jgi:hypothetical protein
MNLRFKFTAVWFWTLVLGLFLGNANAAVAGEAKFEAQLVWATHDENPPKDKENYQPVDEETRKKLESLGLKWKYFYTVKRKEFETKNGDSGKVQISEKSSLAVKLLEDKRVEVVFYNKKDEECSRRKQPLKPGEMLVHGGSVPENATAWLVTLKRVK